MARALPDLRSLLRENIHLAKAGLVKHVHELVLSPKQTQEGPVYEVKGDWKLLPEKECVIWLVARAGHELPHHTSTLHRFCNLLIEPLAPLLVAVPF